MIIPDEVIVQWRKFAKQCFLNNKNCWFDLWTQSIRKAYSIDMKTLIGQLEDYNRRVYGK